MHEIILVIEISGYNWNNQILVPSKPVHKMNPLVVFIGICSYKKKRLGFVCSTGHYEADESIYQ